MNSASIVWFRQDLRLEDQPALQAALEHGGPVIPVFIYAPDEEGAWPPGEASRWWLHQSLKSLDQQLVTAGSRLVIRSGNSLAELTRLIEETQATAIFWNRRYEPAPIGRDKKIKAELKSAGLQVESFNGQLLYEPWEISTKEGRPYQVFTAFWRACQAKPTPSEPLSAPEHIPAPGRWPRSMKLKDLHLEPTRPWVQGLEEAWEPGAASAARQLDRFLNAPVVGYGQARDLPAEPGTSRLSPYLHFGEISPRMIWHAVLKRFPRNQELDGGTGPGTFLKEIVWREFAHHLLYHFPATTDQPLRDEFARFPWADDPSGLKAWQRGRTGYPIVDAGLRELWQTGWMHNRVRMIVASFLVKDLRIGWQQGAAWFWDTLVDADLANNTLGWQWSAGCGADAAPYFRVFNPVLQSEKFDPQGTYLRRWLPELQALPTKWLHAPWAAPRDVLRSAQVTLGKTYPHPIVDHAQARTLALEAFQQLRQR